MGGQGEAYEGQRVAEQDESRRVVGELIGDILQVVVDLIVGLGDLESLLVDLVCVWERIVPCLSERRRAPRWGGRGSE